MATSEVYNMDCMEGMKQFSDKHFELAIVDPPYGIDAGNMNLGNGVGTDSRTWIPKSWDNEIPKMEYFNELFRVSKNQIIWGGNYMTNFLPVSRCWLNWDKIQDFSGSDFEMAWTSFDKPCKSFKMARAVAYTNQVKIHPTQKPVKLYEWLLHNYAKQGDKILDTHLGSQSSRIAADKMGFDFTGYELDKDYFDAGCKRFKEYKSQTVLQF
jgi:site-specific DNA-methyltransferase (adenine-specific)